MAAMQRSHSVIGGSSGSKRDDEGKVVITRYAPELLEAAAKAAGGTFIPADASDKATRVRGADRLPGPAPPPVGPRK